jgi:small GTP-binding protein
LLLVGDKGAGKSSLILRLMTSKFNSQPGTSLDELYTKKLNVNDTDFEIRIRDTKGKETFHSLEPEMYQHLDGVIAVCDKTCRDSFENLPIWIEQVQRFAPENIPILIVATKADQPKTNLYADELGNLAVQYGFDYMEGVSAKSNQRVDEMFLRLISKILQKRGVEITTNELMRLKIS